MKKKTSKQFQYSIRNLIGFFSAIAILSILLSLPNINSNIKVNVTGKFFTRGLIQSNPDLYVVKNWLQVQLRSADKPVNVKVPDGLTDLQLIQFVNTMVNTIIIPVGDDDNYGVPDYWATPEEALKNGGDCEDYAITKYFILKQHGINPADMVLVGILETKSNQYHAILYVTLGDKVYVLDNLNNTREYRNKYYRMVVMVNDFLVILPTESVKPNKTDFNE